MYRSITINIFETEFEIKDQKSLEDEATIRFKF